MPGMTEAMKAAFARSGSAARAGAAKDDDVSDAETASAEAVNARADKAGAEVEGPKAPAHPGQVDVFGEEDEDVPVSEDEKPGEEPADVEAGDPDPDDENEEVEDEDEDTESAAAPADADADDDPIRNARDVKRVVAQRQKLKTDLRAKETEIAALQEQLRTERLTKTAREVVREELAEAKQDKKTLEAQDDDAGLLGELPYDDAIIAEDQAKWFDDTRVKPLQRKLAEKLIASEQREAKLETRLAALEKDREAEMGQRWESRVAMAKGAIAEKYPDADIEELFDAIVDRARSDRSKVNMTQKGAVLEDVLAHHAAVLHVAFPKKKGAGSNGATRPRGAAPTGAAIRQKLAAQRTAAPQGRSAPTVAGPPKITSVRQASQLFAERLARGDYKSHRGRDG